MVEIVEQIDLQMDSGLDRKQAGEHHTCSPPPEKIAEQKITVEEG
jgi:hypothetical protein